MLHVMSVETAASAQHAATPPILRQTTSHAAPLHLRVSPLSLTPLLNVFLQVKVPLTYENFTARRVLTVEWLDGEKLSRSDADDVGSLVQVGVICYLKQLLQTGFFHADPHPGNLIRTPDGRLAILDFGLMTQIDDDIKYGLIEAISHLIHRDYEAIVQVRAQSCITWSHCCSAVHSSHLQCATSTSQSSPSFLLFEPSDAIWKNYRLPTAAMALRTPAANNTNLRPCRTL